MRFIHDDPQFDDLLRVVAAGRGLALSLVEKDYWVTHALWALHEYGFDVWFKGGTSLSKGFGLIERFSAWRTRRSTTNGADRLRKYLARIGIRDLLPYLG